MGAVFHQNMMVFNGFTPARIAAYNTAFNNINNQTGNCFVVAGFTEITRASILSGIVISQMAQQLDPGLTQYVIAEVGITTVGKAMEYIAIAVDPNFFTITHVGTVVSSVLDNNWHCFATPIAQLNDAQCAMIDRTWPWLKGDMRGVAFIAGTYGGNPHVVMFHHNIYTINEKTLAPTAIKTMAAAIRAALPAYAHAEIVCGGDFNVNPRDPNLQQPPRGVVMHQVYEESPPPGSLPYRTTAANCYDYWIVTDVNFTNANAEIFDDTFDKTNHLSDHYAIVLDHF